MKATTLLASALLASTLAFAAGKADKKAPAGAIMKHDVTGTLRWTGYGVGKSHSGNLLLKHAL